MRKLLFPTFFVFCLCSCVSKEGTSDGRRATVQLRDGTSLTGTVVESSAKELVLLADDKTRRALDMKQVKSVEYEESVEPPPPASAAEVKKPAPVRAPVIREEHSHPDEAVITTRTNTLPAGSEIAVRTEEAIDSSKAVEGQTFAAEVTSSLRDADGDLVIPRGANAKIIIRSLSKGSRFKDAADMVLDLKSVSVGGRQYLLNTVDLVRKGHEGVGLNKRTGEFTGAGAAIGAVIGAIAGGGKGAAIGAGSGAGAGAVTQVLTKGGAIKIPVETVLTFKLETPLKVVASR
jgi:hypothetical protein